MPMDYKNLTKIHNMPDNTRHVLALSGGKDSSALAIYLKDKIQNMEYVFCDTGEELEETYEYLNRLEDYLCTKIVTLKSDKDFKYYVDLYGGMLPDPKARWCTKNLKIEPYEKHIGDDPVISYVGIRADEPHRKGYISSKENITTVFPFVEDGLRKEDIVRLLEESGLGLPDYYKWRSRSGCYFCFYQQKREWVGLKENHPDLFEKAKQYEKYDEQTGDRYTWNQGESLDELTEPGRVKQIKKEYEKRQQREASSFKGNQKLLALFQDETDTEQSCNICHL